MTGLAVVLGGLALIVAVAVMVGHLVWGVPTHPLGSLARMVWPDLADCQTANCHRVGLYEDVDGTRQCRRHLTRGTV